MPRNTGERTWVYVKPFSDMDLNYGFASGLESGQRGAFGQTAISVSTPPTNLVIGANNLYPATATRMRTAGRTSSFCGASVVTALKQAGYSIKRGRKPKTRRSTMRSNAVYVTMNGVKYAWNSPNGTLPLPGGELGFQAADGVADAVFGCDFPKPPRVKKISETGTDSISSFCDPSNLNSLEISGWAIVYEGNYTSEHLDAYIG